MPMTTPRSKPKLRRVVATRRIAPAWTRTDAAMSTDHLGEIRARCANRAMACAIEGRLGFAMIYAEIAQEIDRMTDNPFGMSAEQWRDVLTSYARAS